MAQKYRYRKGVARPSHESVSTPTTPPDDSPTSVLMQRVRERVREAKERRAANHNYCYYCITKLNGYFKNGNPRSEAHIVRNSKVGSTIALCDTCFNERARRRRQRHFGIV